MKKIWKFFGTTLTALSMAGAPAPAIMAGSVLGASATTVMAVTVVAMTVPVPAQAVPVSYTGYLSVPDTTAEATQDWAGSSIEWSAENDGTGVWTYRYDIVVAPFQDIIVSRNSAPTVLGATAVSPMERFVLQTGGLFGQGDIITLSPAGGVVGQLSLVAPIYGIVWEGFGCTRCTVQLTSLAPPMLGGVMGGDGTNNLYSAVLDSPLAFNSVIPDGMLLIPGNPVDNNTGGGGGTPVPEPGTLALAFIGLVGMPFVRRKRRV